MRVAPPVSDVGKAAAAASGAAVADSVAQLGRQVGVPGRILVLVHAAPHVPIVDLCAPKFPPGVSCHGGAVGAGAEHASK